MKKASAAGCSHVWRGAETALADLRIFQEQRGVPGGVREHAIVVEACGPGQRRDRRELGSLTKRSRNEADFLFTHKIPKAFGFFFFFFNE